MAPAVTFAEVEELEAAASEKSCPAPEMATVCGLPGALSAIVSVPLRAPPAVGANVTAIVQFAPAATLVPR